MPKERYVEGCKSCKDYNGKDLAEIRAILKGSVAVDGEVYEYAVVAELFGPHYRMINNSGEKASSMTHYHTHLVVVFLCLTGEPDRTATLQKGGFKLFLTLWISVNV